MSASLQTEFAACMHLAKGWILYVTENMGDVLQL